MNFFIIFLIFFLAGIIGILIFNWLNKKTFLWETVIKHLWKQIFQLGYLLSSEIHAGQNETLFVEKYKKKMSLRGNIINSILDFINHEKKEKDEDFEEADEETFGYGRFDFESILIIARNNPPEYFKKLKSI